MSERKIIRTDTSGRDVTNLPGLWSEDDTITDLSQPFTVEWLCEIGFKEVEPDIYHLGEFHVWETAMSGWRCSFPEVATSRCKQITTRGDVMAWLKVLGIVPATTKGNP